MNKYIVPYDFEVSGESALNFAQELAKKGNAKVTILHVVKNEVEKKEAESKMTSLLDSKGLEIEYKVFVGDLINDLAALSIKLDGDTVVMAKQHEGNLKKMFGSRAIKVITDSSIPFLIIQEGHKFRPQKKIALTIDTRSESTHILRSVVDFCKIFDAEVIIVGGIQDDPKKEQKVKENINTLTKQLENNNIKHAKQLLPRKGFEMNLMEFVQTQNVDLIAVTYYKKGSSLFSSSFVEHLLENKQGIPILTIGGQEIPAFQKIVNNMVCPISVERIDSNISRITVLLNVVLMSIFLYTYNPIFAYIVAVDYFIRAVSKPIFSPLRFVAAIIVKPLSLKNKPINLAPKVFASRLGMLCAVGSVIFYFMDMYLASIITMGILMILSFADSVLNFCVGCLIYNYIVYPFYKHRIR
jgi:nucleotide-binding universal stress UspA family protein